MHPENGGKAVGWVHTKNDNTDEPLGHAIMYVVKIPLQLLERDEQEMNGSPEWVRMVVDLCRMNLPESANGSSNGNDDKIPTDSPMQLNKDDTNCLRSIIAGLGRHGS